MTDTEAMDELYEWMGYDSMELYHGGPGWLFDLSHLLDKLMEKTGRWE